MENSPVTSSGEFSNCSSMHSANYDEEPQDVPDLQTHDLERNCLTKMVGKKELLVIDNSFLGLRGIMNLGRTCYMNSIIHVLLNVPEFRDYFLRDRPSCQVENPNECLICEMFSFFQKTYSEKTWPVCPSTLLYIMWKNAENISGHEDQDAHEFLIRFRDTFHLHSTGSELFSNEVGCCCIIEKVFAGCYESRISCNECGKSSITEEKFYDISLNLRNANEKPAAKRQKTQHKISLGNCLDRFTAPEMLDKRECDFCKKNESSTKFLSIKKLPNVLTFHLKRIISNKKDTSSLMFPEVLDMSPYIVKKNPAVVAEHENLKSKYMLFGVVIHKGSIESGHFFTFVKHNFRLWFKCNDEVITNASFNMIMKHNSNAYLLFYHKV